MADRISIGTKLGELQCPAIARQPKAPRGIELLFDGRHDRSDRIRPGISQRLVAHLHLTEDVLDASNIGRASSVACQLEDSRSQMAIGVIDLHFARDRRYHRRFGLCCPLDRQIRGVAIDRRDGHREQRCPFGGRIRQLRGSQGLFDGLLSRWRRQQRLNQWGRIDHRHQVQVEALRARRRAKGGNRLVQHADHLPNVRLLVVVMLRGPVGQQLPRALDNGQALGGVGCHRHVIERLGDDRRQHRVVGFAARRRVSTGARRLRVIDGSRPIHAIRRNIDEVQLWVVDRRGRRH